MLTIKELETGLKTMYFGGDWGRTDPWDPGFEARIAETRGARFFNYNGQFKPEDERSERIALGVLKECVQQFKLPDGKYSKFQSEQPKQFEAAVMALIARMKSLGLQ